MHLVLHEHGLGGTSALKEEVVCVCRSTAIVVLLLHARSPRDQLHGAVVQAFMLARLLVAHDCFACRPRRLVLLLALGAARVGKGVGGQR